VGCPTPANRNANSVTASKSKGTNTAAMILNQRDRGRAGEFPRESLAGDETLAVEPVLVAECCFLRAAAMEIQLER
jgi:hypothetical protein